MAQRESRKHRLGDGSSVGAPPSKREHRTGLKRPLPEDQEDNGSDMEESSSEMDLTQMQTQDEKETDLSMTLKEAEIGVLEKLVLINFMCHEKLELTFNPNVNFILGRNGSGKSAIMTGVVVALGGKARSTERGSSLKQFIRTGAQSAEAIVYLRNRGPDAFNPDEYGDTIICERQIREDGTGGYKIKSAKGRIVSTKKETLDAILDHCCIQIDNPVSLLNQDTSRNFLHSSKPSAKYKLFMKATHLEQIAIDYEHSKEEQKLMETTIEHIRASLPTLKDEAKKLEEQVDSFKRFTEMESKVEQLENELKWAIIVEMENTTAPIEADIQKEKNRIPRNEGKMKTTQANVGKAKEEIKLAQKGLDDITVDANQVKDERISMAAEKREKQKRLREKQTSLRSLSKKIADEESEKKALEKAKQDCIIASQRDIAGEKEAKLKRLQDLEDQLRRVDGEIATSENDRHQFDAALRTSQDKLQAHRSKESGVEGQIRGCKEQLQRLHSSRNDKLAAFGANMRTLVDELYKNRQKFRHLPKGPIGSLISLKDYKWNTAIEQVVKMGILRAFAVDNHQDADTYKAIARRVMQGRPIPEAIISSFEGRVYDVSQYHAQSMHPTAYDMLKVEDPDVMNLLIDQCHVESILLIEQRAVAANVIVHERPTNAREAYTIEGDLVQARAHYSNKRGSFGIIQASVDNAIKEENDRLSHLHGDLHQLNQEGQAIASECDVNKRQLAALGAKIHRRLGEKKKLSIVVTKLRNAREEEEPEEDTATYESEIAELEEKIVGLVTERNAQDEVIKKINEEYEEILQRSRVCEGKVEQVAGKMEELKARLEAGEHKKMQAERLHQQYKDRLAEIQTNISSLKDKLEKQEEEILSAIGDAEESGERIDTERSRKNIMTEIKTLKRHIAEDQPSLEEQEAVVQRYTTAMEEYQKLLTTVKTTKKTLQVMRKSLNLRISNYQKLQERVATRTSYFFSYFLQQRDYDGKIKFDHNKEHLIIEVKVDSHTKKSQSTSNTKALSGGERSFSTVCFIMALWDAIQAPFRCLDEFDVFMDMMNRRISMRMMMELAEEKSTRQFIFFTPQDMSAMCVAGKKMVKVLRLREPVRGGQTTLD